MGKLVRDKIPQIIIEKGGFPRTRILEKAEYVEALKDKLSEEVEEYLESGEIEELADICEVVDAISLATGSDPDEVDKLRKEKASQRGGFTERLYLEGVDE